MFGHQCDGTTPAILLRSYFLLLSLSLGPAFTKHFELVPAFPTPTLIHLSSTFLFSAVGDVTGSCII